jgi:hypothetical protein
VKQRAADHHPEEGVLKEAARAIGGAAGTLAAFAISVMPHEKAAAPVAKRTGKLPAKKKARLPRKQKKMAARKTA